MRNLKKFETHAEYEAAKSSLILPNVSICKDTPNEVHYNPIVPPETRLVAKFNITSTSPTMIAYRTSGFSAVEIDGVEQPTVVGAYTFDTLGEHTVKYTLTDPATIGNVALYSCSGITSVTIPDSVTSIGYNAFNGCNSLTSIVIPDSVTSIGDNAFQSCSGVTSCTIGSGVTSIGDYSFSVCKSLTSIDIPNSVTSIGKGAFYNCGGLTSITMESTIPPILGGNNVFNNTNDCPIYVPSESVETYKAELFWSDLSSRIQAME